MIPGICKTEFSINIHVTALFDTMFAFFVHYLLYFPQKTIFSLDIIQQYLFISLLQGSFVSKTCIYL